MRDADADAIRTQLDIWENGSREQTLAMHRLEVLRDLLLRDDDALTVLLNDYPGVDAQRLRTLIREGRKEAQARSEEHTSELQSLMRTSYAVFCLNKKIRKNETNSTQIE